MALLFMSMAKKRLLKKTYYYNDQMLVSKEEQRTDKRSLTINANQVISRGQLLIGNTYTPVYNYYDLRGFLTSTTKSSERTEYFYTNERLMNGQNNYSASGALKSTLGNYSYDDAGNILTFAYTAYTSNGNYTDTYNYSYIDTYKGKQVSSINVSSTANSTGVGTTRNTYDNRGRLISSNITEVHASNSNSTGTSYLKFTYNMADQIIAKAEDRFDGSSVYKVQSYYYAGNGGELASLGQLKQDISPLAAMYQGGNTPITYTVSEGDTLMGIARTLYGDSSLWYLIADANGLRMGPTDEFGVQDVGRNLRLPSIAQHVDNTSTNFKFYDPSDVVGDLTPTVTYLPPPRKKKSSGNVFKKIEKEAKRGYDRIEREVSRTGSKISAEWQRFSDGLEISYDGLEKGVKDWFDEGNTVGVGYNGQDYSVQVNGNTAYTSQNGFSGPENNWNGSYGPDAGGSTPQPEKKFNLGPEDLEPIDFSSNPGVPTYRPTGDALTDAIQMSSLQYYEYVPTSWGPGAASYLTVTEADVNRYFPTPQIDASFPALGAFSGAAGGAANYVLSSPEDLKYISPASGQSAIAPVDFLGMANGALTALGVGSVATPVANNWSVPNSYVWQDHAVYDAFTGKYIPTILSNRDANMQWTQQLRELYDEKVNIMQSGIGQGTGYALEVNEHVRDDVYHEIALGNDQIGINSLVDIGTELFLADVAFRGTLGVAGALTSRTVATTSELKYLPFDRNAQAPLSPLWRPSEATNSVDSVGLRIQQLTVEGHGVQRHGAGVTPIQLEGRSVQGLDPMTGTRIDGVHGGTHQYAQHATKVVSDEAYIYAENYARNSQQFVDVTTASTTGRAQLEIPLRDIYGANFQEYVYGVTRYGPKNSPFGFGNTAFSDNAYMVVRYKQSSTGNWLFNTMFPQP